ncbi:MAG TPA: lytic transglycosylase domain-containing protein [Rhizomicrobium sp.]|nr:lytic transglycosylase domain-containing protein [Rhizomicrobium sp.]
MPLVPLTVACISFVAVHFGISEDVLKGLRAAEGGQVGMVTQNRDKAGRVTSRDLGPFQVNDVAWLDHLTLAWHRPNRQATFELLRDNGCANALAAGAIFRGYLDEAGGNYGLAVGYYNSHSPEKAEIYRRHFIASFRHLSEFKDLQ